MNGYLNQIAKGTEDSMEARLGCELAFMERVLAEMHSPDMSCGALRDENGTVYQLDLTFTTASQKAVLRLVRQGKNGRWKNSFAVTGYYKRA